MRNVTLNVEGMSCAHCENAIKNAVMEIDGVTDVTVNLQDKTVTVQCGGAIPSEADIKEVIEDQGYDVI